MKYDELPDMETVTDVRKVLESKKYKVFLVEDEHSALEKIKELIPKGASVMNGSSKTLEQIGFVDYLKSGKHEWNDLHKNILSEKDKVEQLLKRKQATLSDYYLGSVHALMKNGEFIIASKTGSQLPHVVYTSSNLIFVISIKKIVNTFNDGMDRLINYVVPLEEKNSLEKYGEGTKLNKIVIFKGEHESSGRKIFIILINKNLGF